eukprot:TRINITY_DN9416_c0_g1::TRINITY_DN9416_c0_g1_i1::g.237::m.237 TRINITY_DN9416_c0_g1::TRINITY_DN9416_c0_g1_i1::g.237  ORF type:complete len:132 (-),score=6.70,sp/Q9STZ2/SELT_ARATH/33.33/7e-17,Rdx/PF10262.4/4.1e-08 TRINITY_DN9416_c0_g1_i1:294-689(-)
MPELNVVGTEYLPSRPRQITAQLLGYGQIATWVVTFWGDTLFPVMGVTPPSFYQHMKDNKLQTFLASWILGNAGSQAMMSTGAFEIMYDGQIVFSKLDTGRLPSLEEVVTRISDIREESAELPNHPGLPTI